MARSFEHFDRQERSPLIDEHGPGLAAEAVELQAVHPQAQVVGVILEADAPAAAAFRQALEKERGRPLNGTSFVGLAPRSWALDVLQATAPEAREWLVPGDGEEPQLPVLAATKDGVRLGTVPLNG